MKNKVDVLKIIVLGLAVGFNAIAMREDLGDELYEALHHKSLDELLIDAVKNNDVEKVRVLLNNRAEVNGHDENGRPPLFIAASEGFGDIAKLLIEHHAHVNDNDLLGEPIIHIAAKNGFQGICRDLIEHGANANAKGPEFMDFLMQEAIRGHGMPPDMHAKIQENGTTPLMEATMQGNVPVITALLTTVPRREVLKNFPGLIAIQHAQPRLPRDVRKLASQSVINRLVQDHMRKVREMMATKNRMGHNAFSLAMTNGDPETALLLDVANPESYEAIRSQVEANIKRILSTPMEKPAAQPELEEVD